jgi:hypothetical protein
MRKPTKKQINEQINRIAVLGIKLADTLLAYEPVESVTSDGRKTTQCYLPIQFYAEIGRLDDVERSLQHQLEKAQKTNEKVVA